MLAALVTAGLIFLSQHYTVNGHSWVECTSYIGTIKGQDYNSSDCKGYIRGWASYNPTSFGVDHGANHNPSTNNWCQKTISNSSTNYSSSYNSTFNIASYTTGKTYRVVWPAKNHANYECNSNIPDYEMKLYMNTVRDPSSDPSTISNWTLIYDWHAIAHKNTTTGVDGVPFQNCPSFCNNTDKAVCYGDFSLNSSYISESGYYTFMWYWAFNSETDLYTDCWEAYVTLATNTGGSGSGSSGNRYYHGILFVIVLNILVLLY